MGHRSQSIGIDELYAEWDKLVSKDPTEPGWVKASVLANRWGITNSAAQQRLHALETQGKVSLVRGRRGHLWARLK
jgi:ribosomal protein S25